MSPITSIKVDCMKDYYSFKLSTFKAVISSAIYINYYNELDAGIYVSFLIVIIVSY